MKLEQLDVLLNISPVVLRTDPLSTQYLDEVKVAEKLIDLKIEFDQKKLIDFKRIVISDQNCPLTERFPEVRLEHNPYSIELNEVLFTNYLGVLRYGFSQKDISKVICEDTSVDLIILILVDGLSYDDCKERMFIRPCLVNGATITQVGFRNIIGNPPICFKLFSKGFKKRIGFSYWDRENFLTNELFTGFDSERQMVKIDEFEKIVEKIKDLDLTKTYIQIGITGLDQLSHSHRDRPMKKEWINKLFSEQLKSIEEIVEKKGLSAKIYLTSDHGIWWKPRSDEQQAILIPEIKLGYHSRYLEGHYIRNYVINASSYGKSYSLLKYPYIYRDFKSTEWGIHGGVSYFESVVPFYRKDIF